MKDNKKIEAQTQEEAERLRAEMTDEEIQRWIEAEDEELDGKLSKFRHSHDFANLNKGPDLDEEEDDEDAEVFHFDVESNTAWKENDDNEESTIATQSVTAEPITESERIAQSMERLMVNTIAHRTIHKVAQEMHDLNQQISDVTQGTTLKLGLPADEWHLDISQRAKDIRKLSPASIMTGGTVQVYWEEIPEWLMTRIYHDISNAMINITQLSD